MLEYIRKILGSGNTTLIISNDETEDIIEIVMMWCCGVVIINTARFHLGKLDLSFCGG